MNVLTAAISAAVSGVSGNSLTLNGQPRAVVAQFNFNAGSGGTSVTAWLQTSLDDGITWTDIAAQQFTTTSSRIAVNFSSQTPQTTAKTLTSGTMSAGSSLDGVLGTQFRVVYTVVGTYTGATLAVDIQADELQR